MHIIPLSEGSFTVDATKKFIPFANTDHLKERTKGSLLVEIQPFIIITKDDIILLDTGLGFSDSRGNLQLHNNLVNAGINPLEITYVLMSHLHKDHAGGISRRDAFTGERHLSFPHARYVINKNEFDSALRSPSSSYVKDDLSALINSDQLMLVENNGNIGATIRYEMSGGHSPWHQVFWIEEAGEIAFFGGDVAPQLMQMKTKFVAKYDHDGKRSSQLRSLWWNQGNAEGWHFLFYHDIKTPVYHISSRS